MPQFITKVSTILICVALSIHFAQGMTHNMGWTAISFILTPAKQTLLLQHETGFIHTNTLQHEIRKISFTHDNHQHYKHITVKTSSSLCISSRYDNLIAGISEISMGASLGVLWSEYAILLSGCGPLNLSDGLERLCYQILIVSSSLLLFFFITTGGKRIESICLDYFGYLENATLLQVRAAEVLNVLAVIGSFLALGSQIGSGADMDGLSGIDVEMCRAMKDYLQ